MAVTLFFSAFMSAIVWFFILSDNLASPTNWIYAVGMLLLFARMVHTREYSRWRRVFMVSFAFFFTISFMGILHDERGSMALSEVTIASAEVPFCQIVIPAIIAPFALTGKVIFPARMSGHFASVIGVFLLWFIATITIGRGWCGWVCFYGGWEEGASRILKRPRIDTLSRNADVRSVHYAFLGFIALVSLGMMASVYCQWFCPFKLVTEFSAITDLESLLAAVLFIAIFLALVIVLPVLTRKRTQCSSLCPFGAFQSLLAPVSGFRVAIDTEKCARCMKCAIACPFFAIDRNDLAAGTGRTRRNCALCGECIAVCPTGAIRYEFASALKKRNNAEGSWGKPGASCRRPAAGTSFGRFVQAILEPEYLFVFTAFTLSVVVSGKFVPDALDRLAGACTGWLR